VSVLLGPRVVTIPETVLTAFYNYLMEFVFIRGNTIIYIIIYTHLGPTLLIIRTVEVEISRV